MQIDWWAGLLFEEVIWQTPNVRGNSNMVWICIDRSTAVFPQLFLREFNMDGSDWFKPGSRCCCTASFESISMKLSLFQFILVCLLSEHNITTLNLQISKIKKYKIAYSTKWNVSLGMKSVVWLQFEFRTFSLGLKMS